MQQILSVFYSSDEEISMVLTKLSLTLVRLFLILNVVGYKWPLSDARRFCVLLRDSDFTSGNVRERVLFISLGTWSYWLPSPDSNQGQAD